MTPVERRHPTALPSHLERRFANSDLAEPVLVNGAYEVITGFGPTNAPTAGTLSVMLAIIDVQRALRAPMTVVISDLGAWNCRNVAWAELCRFRDRMKAFLVALGFSETIGTIRTHTDPGNLIRAGRVARFLTFDDIEQHQEAFLALYNSQGLLGSRVGLLVDTLYTVADILQPIERGYAGSLVLCGLEEKYFVQLARTVLQRQAEDPNGLGWKGCIGALLCRVVRGFGGYPKMSKSIEHSSIHVGLSADEIANRVLSQRDEDQAAVLDAIQLASDWPESRRSRALAVFESLPESAAAWRIIKQEYIGTFRRFSRLWELTA